MALTEQQKRVLSEISPADGFRYFASMYIETADILNDSVMMAALRQSIEELTEGKTIPWEQARKELDLE